MKEEKNLVEYMSYQRHVSRYYFSASYVNILLSYVYPTYELYNNSVTFVSGYVVVLLTLLVT